jgi:hypothetical protein
MQDIKELLREIRDLQKAHFERYKEFTQAALDRQKTAAEETRRAREDQLRYRQELRQRASGMMIARWVLVAIAITLAVSSVVGVMLASVLGRIPN